ncbi:hypothetical protein [Roseibium sp. LAB1]
MNLFLPFFSPFAALHRVPSRQSRLKDIDARMASFLREKQTSDTTCPKVLDNVKTARSTVQHEMATAR